ncbi:cysteine desulfurase family protein [Asticcacaulis solisilvae]|uniref:cysteine desulfurase family protein n=1 Tax=Asticcacaulis solisilvae TaxID=1217274 RepID=UPI003FD712C7
MIYLDNNASTRLCDEAFEAMLPWLRDNWANPSSIRHQPGRQARRAVEGARESLAETLHCRPDEIVFTSGATEANALVMRGARLNGQPPRRILIARTEHVSVIAAAVQAAGQGAIAFAAPRENGAVTADNFEALDPGPDDLISVALMGGETGIVNDVEAVIAMARNRGAAVHVDASQAPGRTAPDLIRFRADYATYSSHKIHGPKGTGLLMVRDGAGLEPLWTGGTQEGRRRGGTENVPAIVGFAAAAMALTRPGHDFIAPMRALRDRFEARLKAETGCVVIGEQAPRAANTAMLAWPGLANTELLAMLDRHGICASAGSACSSATEGFARALRALSLPPETVSGSVRFSLSRDTTADEIETAADIVRTVVADLT